MSYNPNHVTLRGRDLFVGNRLSLTVTTDGDLQITNNSGLSVQILSLQTSVSNLALSVANSNTCDARLKTDVVTISTAIDTINRLRPVEFTWKDDIQNVERRNTRDAGFIAQEINSVIPYTEIFMGHSGADGGEPIRGVRHERVIPYLVKAIQELTAELSELRSRMSA